MTAKDSLPKKLKNPDELKKLGRRVKNAIDAGIRAKGKLPERIALNEKLARNVNVKPEKLPWEGAQHFHIPLMGPKLNQRKANVVRTLTAQVPMVRLSHIGERTSVDRMERTIQFFLDIVGFKETLDKAVEMAMEANQPTIRVSFQDHPDGWKGATHTGHFSGIVFDVIHPNQFVCWPDTDAGIEGAKFAGHAFDSTVGEVKYNVEKGFFLKHEPVSGSSRTATLADDDSKESILDRTATSGDDDDEVVMLYEGIWRDRLEDDEERLYRVVVDANGPGEILFCEPYRYQFPWYVSMAVKKEPGKFWAEGSPAQDVQGLQLLLNSLVNEYIWGTQMNSRPPILTENWTLDEGMVGYEPGEVRDVRAVGKSFPIPTGFSAAGYDSLIQLVRSMAEAATKTSDAVTGAPAVTREATATEQNIKWEAFQIGASDDITEISPALRRVIVLMLDQLEENFDTWFPVYRDSVPIENRELFYKKYVVELAGKSPEDSPQMQAQQAQMLLQMVQAVPALGIPEVQRQLLNSIIVGTSLPNKDAIIRAINTSFGVADNEEVPNVEPSSNLAGAGGMEQILQLLGVQGDGGGMGVQTGNGQTLNPTAVPAQ